MLVYESYAICPEVLQQNQALFSSVSVGEITPRIGRCSPHSKPVCQITGDEIPTAEPANTLEKKARFSRKSEPAFRKVVREYECRVGLFQTEVAG